MNLSKLMVTGFAAVAMLAFTVGCQPEVNVSTSTSMTSSDNSTGSANTTGGSNTTAGAETPGGETP